MIDEGALWILFIILVPSLLILDIGVLNRKDEVISIKKASILSAFWISIGVSFGIIVFLSLGADRAVEYYAAYTIEYLLSVDNLFIFMIIFSYFAVPDRYQHKVLFYGIIGALVFRMLFIFAGIQLLEKFDIVMYVFGAVLIYTALRTVLKKDDSETSLDRNIFVRVFKKFMRVSDGYEDGHFFTKENGVRTATPLLLTVLVLEMTDILFAFDSVPAVLSMSQDMLIAYTSNVFAILGLRSLFFALKGALSSLRYLKYGLGVILAFIGIKMLIPHYYTVDVYQFLAVVMSVLVVTAVLSVIVTRRKGTA